MSTPQEEAERRFGYSGKGRSTAMMVSDMRLGFIAGAEWLAGEIGLTVEQVQRLGPLVEAALELLDVHGPANYEQAVANVIYAASRLRAAALDGGIES